MRVLLHQGARVTLANMTPSASIAVIACINTGSLALLPDNSIAEPVEVFASEMDAQAHREKMVRDNPGQDFRVVLNAE